MSEKLKAFLDMFVLIVIAIAAISGGAGGCLVVAQKVLRGRNTTAAFVAAYATIGAIFAVVGTIMMMILTTINVTLLNVILVSICFGVAGSLSLAGTHLAARVRLKRLGLEFDASVRPIPIENDIMEVETKDAE